MNKAFDRPTEHCTFCPRLCRHACPVETASARESLTPRNKMMTMRAIGKGARVEKETAALLWGCSDCGACEDACLHANPVGAALYEGRAIAFDQQLAPAPMHEMVKRFARQLNPSGDSLLHAQEEATGEVLRSAQSSSGAPATQLVLGCEALTHSPALAKTAMQVARRLDENVQPASLRDRPTPVPLCCGRVLREAGALAEYEAQKALVRAALKDSEVWVLEPACLQDVRAAVPGARLLSEVMVKQGLEPSQRADTLSLQSSCGVAREPAARESLFALAQRVSDDVRVPAPDLPFAGCCGGRGGLREVMPEVAAEMGKSRQQELSALGAPPAHFSTCCGAQLGVDARHLLTFFE